MIRLGPNFVDESNARFDRNAMAYAHRLANEAGREGEQISIEEARRLYMRRIMQRMLQSTGRTIEEIRESGLNADVDT
jgi:hypothetical protein